MYLCKYIIFRNGQWVKAKTQTCYYFSINALCECRLLPPQEASVIKNKADYNVFNVTLVTGAVITVMCSRLVLTAVYLFFHSIVSSHV